MGVLSKRISTLIPFGKTIWEAKWKQLILFPQYYKETNITINMTFDENESIIDYKCLSNVLDVVSVLIMLCCLCTIVFLKGTVAKFSLPNVKSAFRLNLNSLPAAESTKGAYSNVSGINSFKSPLKVIFTLILVSEDVNVKTILENRSDIDLVIPLSALRCIANGSNLKRRWMIPFSVKTVPVNKG